jgi:hypothetical protein
VSETSEDLLGYGAAVLWRPEELPSAFITRIVHTLFRAEIYTIGDLTERSAQDLLDVRQFRTAIAGRGAPRPEARRPEPGRGVIMSAWQPCGRRLRECIDDVCRSMGECAWPPGTHAGLDTGVKGTGAADSVSSEVMAAPAPARSAPARPWSPDAHTEDE